MIDSIIDIVCKRYSVTRDELTGPSKAPGLAKPRFIAMYFLRYHTDMTLVQIGDLFNRDHSTTINAISVCRERYMEDIGTIKPEIVGFASARLEGWRMEIDRDIQNLLILKCDVEALIKRQADHRKAVENEKAQT